MRRLTPRTLFLMPTVSIIGGTSGWFLAVALGFTALPWPDYGWVAAALVLVTLMTIQGLGFLTPVNVIVCLELQKAEPDMKRITGLDAAILLRRGAARHDAGGDPDRDDAVSHRHLKRSAGCACSSIRDRHLVELAAVLVDDGDEPAGPVQARHMPRRL